MNNIEKTKDRAIQLITDVAKTNLSNYVFQKKNKQKLSSYLRLDFVNVCAHLIFFFAPLNAPGIHFEIWEF